MRVMFPPRSPRRRRVVLDALHLGMAAALLGACGESTPPTADASTTTADVSVVIEGEDTISGGLVAGDELEQIRDGWSVDFDDYVVVIGAVELRYATDPSMRVTAPRELAIDLTQVAETGAPLASLSGLATGRWEVHYQTGRASAATERDPTVSEGTFDAMVAGGWTYHVAGTMTHPDGQSCPPAGIGADLRAGATPNGNTNADGDACYDNPSIGFEVGVDAATRFGPCQIDEVPGLAVSGGPTTTAALTIHGDHLFFNGFPEGMEGGITRLAQWLADCDLNLDGAVDLDELSAIAPADLAEIDDRFQLGGSPITPLSTMLDYVTAQLKTQGHFQGEGECAIAP